MSEQVRVIVVNWNGKAFLEACLQNLWKQTCRSFSVTLVNNSSTDGSLERVSSHFPEVRVIALKENLGFAGANNCALRDLTTPYVLLLNNDAVADPRWLGHRGLTQSEESFYERFNIQRGRISGRKS